MDEAVLWIAPATGGLFVQPDGFGIHLEGFCAHDAVNIRQERSHTLQIALEFGVLVVGQLDSDGGYTLPGQIVAKVAGDGIAGPTLLWHLVARASREGLRQTGGGYVPVTGVCEDGFGGAVIKDRDPGIIQKIANSAGFGFREWIVSASARMWSFETDRVGCPVIASAAIQIRISIPIEVHIVGVPSVACGQAVGVHRGDEPQADLGWHLFGISLEVL